MRRYTEGELLKSLREMMEVPQGRSQKDVATKLGFSPQFINDVLGGRRAISDNLAESLGFRKVSYYERKGKVA